MKTLKNIAKIMMLIFTLLFSACLNSESLDSSLTLDVNAPESVSSNSVLIKVKTNADNIKIGGETLSKKGEFEYKINLEGGKNELVITATKSVNGGTQKLERILDIFSYSEGANIADFNHDSESFGTFIYPAQNKSYFVDDFNEDGSLKLGIKRDTTGIEDPDGDKIIDPTLESITAVLDVTQSVYSGSPVRFGVGNDVGIYSFLDSELRDFQMIAGQYMVEKYTSSLVTGITNASNSVLTISDFLGADQDGDPTFPAEYLAIEDDNDSITTRVYSIVSIDTAAGTITVKGNVVNDGFPTLGTDVTISSVYIDTQEVGAIPGQFNKLQLNVNTSYNLSQGKNSLALIVEDLITGASSFVGKDKTNPIDFLVDSMSPEINLVYPINEGRADYEADGLGGYENLRIEMISEDSNSTGNRLYMYGLITNDNSITDPYVIGVAANKILDIDGSHINNSILKIDTDDVISVNTLLGATGVEDTLYIVISDDIDDGTQVALDNAYGNLKMIKRTISVPIPNLIDFSQITESLEIKVDNLAYKEYVEDFSVTGTELNFLLKSAEKFGNAYVKRVVLEGTVSQPITIPMQHEMGDETYIANFDLIKDLEYESLGTEKYISLEIEMVDSAQKSITKVVKLKYVNETNIETEIKDDDIVFYTAYAMLNPANVIGAGVYMSDNVKNKFYFNGNPNILGIGIENPKYDYVVKIKDVNNRVITYQAGDTTDVTETKFSFEFDDVGTDLTASGQGIEQITLDASDLPKQILQIWLGEKKIKEMELIFVNDYNANIVVDEIEIMQNQSSAIIKGIINNFPKEVLSEYDLQVQFINNTGDTTGFYTIPEEYIGDATDSSNEVTFEGKVPYIYNGRSGRQFDIMNIKLYMKNIDNTVPPINFQTVNLDNLATDDTLIPDVIKVSGIDDKDLEWKISDEETIVQIDNYDDYDSVNVYLGKTLLSTFVNGDVIDFKGTETLLRIEGVKATGGVNLLNISRNISIQRPTVADKPVFTEVPTNNYGYTTTQEFIVAGKVENASSVELVSFYEYDNGTKGSAVTWNGGTVTPLPKLVLLEDGTFASRNLSDDIDQAGGGTGTYTDYADAEGVIEGKGYLITIRAIKEGGAYVDYTYSCFYDTLAPTFALAPGTAVGTTGEFVSGWTIDELYLDSSTVLREDSDDSLYSEFGGAIKTGIVDPDWSFKTVGGTFEFDIDEEEGAIEKGYIGLLRNQKGYSDQLLMRVPISEEDGDLLNSDISNAGGETIYEMITVIVEDEIENLIARRNIQSDATGKERELVIDLGDNNIETFYVYLMDNHQNITEKVEFNNTVFLDFDAPNVTGVIEEGSFLSPSKAITIDSIEDLVDVDLKIYKELITPSNLVAEISNQDLNNGLELPISGDVNTGDKLIVTANDKYGNNTFKKTGLQSLEISMTDKLIPLLPTNIVVENNNYPEDQVLDIVNGQVLDYSGKAEAFVDVVVVDITGNTEYSRGKTDLNGKFKIPINGDIIYGDPANNKIRLKVVDSFGNSTVDSAVHAKYLDVTNKFASSYEYTVIGGSVTASVYHKRFDVVDVTWNDLSEREQGPETDDTTDKGKGNTINRYEVIYKIDNVEILRKKDIMSTSTSFITNDLDQLKGGPFDLTDITVEIYGISNLGFWSYAGIITNVKIDTNIPNLEGLNVNRIQPSVKSDIVTIYSDAINTSVVGMGIAGDKIFVVVDGVAKEWTGGDMTFDYSVADIENDEVFNIKLKDIAGNESEVVKVTAYDDEAPALAGIKLVDSIEISNGRMYLPITYTLENNVQVIARDFDTDAQIGQINIAVANEWYTAERSLEIDSVDKTKVKLYVKDSNGNVTTGFITVEDLESN